MSHAILFPGQGAQFVGMGKDLAEAFPAARTLFERASEALGFDLAAVCFDGPEEELTRTDICQPGILVTSLAAAEALRARGHAPAYAVAAGLSLGEFTALCFAGAFDVETAVRIVGRRGALMQEACEAAPGGMAQLMGLDRAIVEGIAGEARGGDALVVGNYNAPGHYVLSGSAAALDRAEALAAEAGARRFVRLKVAGAYHSPLMHAAADGLREALAGAEIREPDLPVLSNVTGRPHGDAASIRAGLVAQVERPVRWEDCMMRLVADGVAEADEVGPGRVLRGLLRAIDRSVQVSSYCALDSLPEA